MFKDIAVRNINGRAFTVRYREIYPDTCPICHNGINPIHHHTVFTGENINDKSDLQFVFQCPKLHCQRLFIAIYRFYRNPPSGIDNYYTLYGVTPIVHKSKEFNEQIKKTSPSFIEIYNQSLYAECEGLTQLTGAGLRKALEFLIKDYLRKKGMKKKDVEKLWLGDCIKNYIKDVNIKLCAERATWLGNDEIHYRRLWKDKDIRHLKQLIELTVNWIDNELLTKKYTKTMPKKKKIS